MSCYFQKQNNQKNEIRITELIIIDLLHLNVIEYIIEIQIFCSITCVCSKPIQ